MMDHLFKKTEKILYELKNIDLRIKNIDLYIDNMVNDVSVSGISYAERTGSTNAFHSIVESEVIRRDEHLTDEVNKLKQAKKDLMTMKDLATNAVESLDQEDSKLVELRYFQKNKKTWIEIGMSLGMDKDTCCREKNRIINYLSGYIFPTGSIPNQFFINF